MSSSPNPPPAPFNKRGLREIDSRTKEERVPIYEYRCGACGKGSSFFTRSISSSLHPLCSHCDSSDMHRTVSRFAYHKGLKTIQEESGPPPGHGAPSLDYYKDPRNVGRNVEDAFQKYGVEMPEGVRETIDAARDGELPEGPDL